MTEHDRPEPVQSSFPGESSQIRPKGESDVSPTKAYGEPDEGTSGQALAPGQQKSKDAKGLPANSHHEDLAPLFESQHTKELQQRWHDIQAAFVDDPHDAIRQAASLNDEIVSALTAGLDDRKRTLEQGIAKGDTEQLRIGMRQYRQMLDQILTL